MQRTATTLLILATGLLLSGCITIQPPTVAQDDDRTETTQPTAPGSSLDTECGDGDSILLNEPGIEYELRGDCAEVIIEGADIEVDAENIESLTIRGDRNSVDANIVGSVEINGQENELDADEVGSITIAGDRNEVDGKLGVIVFSGNDNVADDDDDDIGSVTDNGSGNRVE